MNPKNNANNDRARQNLEALRANAYPGRGIVVGLDEAGESLVQVYWIMGRSANSRNRVFVVEGGCLRTAPADPSKVADPTLIIYHAMAELPGRYIVTNGDQTDTVVQALRVGGDFRQALNTRQYEPDAPNFTPRISALCSLADGEPWAELAVLKRSAATNGCERHFFRYETFAPGLGHAVTTYQGDGNPLPPFEGEPFTLPLDGDIEGVAESLWGALNKDNRVALAVKFIDLSSGASELGVLNRYTATP